METKLFLKKILFSLFFALCLSGAEAQEKIRLQVWSAAEPLPNMAAEYEGLPPFAFPARNLQKITAFFLSGLVYGWEFTYTPSDTARNVKDFFHFEGRFTIEETDKHTTYEKTFFSDNKVYCWVNYQPSPEQVLSIQAWKSASFPKIQGTGSAPVSDGIKAIQDACGKAIESAIRNYARKKMKNKPKEITGSVLLVREPGIKIENGQYVAEVSLFLSIKQVIPYSVF